MNDAEVNKKRLFADTQHLSLATVSVDGSPYGTWLRFVSDEKYIYFDNVPESAHVSNIRRDPRVYLTILNLDGEDSISGYIRSRAEILTGAEAEQALVLLGTVGTPDPVNNVYCRVKIGEIDTDKKAKNPQRQFYFVNREEEG